MWAYTSSAGTESGLVEGVCVLHIKIDGYGVVVAVKVSLGWRRGAGRDWYQFDSDSEVRGKKGPHHWIPWYRKWGWWGLGGSCEAVEVVIDRECWGWDSNAQRWGHRRHWCTEKLCSPTQTMGDAWLCHGWDAWVEQCSLMLDLGVVGSGRRKICHMATILALFRMPSSPWSIPKRAWPLSLSFFVSVPTLVPPSHSSSPTFLPHPCLISFGISPPQDYARALTHSRNPSAPILILILILIVVCGVGILIIDCAVCGPSCTKMVADTVSEGILHTVIVCGILAWQQLTLISMWGALGWSEWA